MCAKAQKYSEYLVKNDKFEHSKKENRNYKGGPLGENLAYVSGTNTPVDTTGARATTMWYDEISDFNFGNPGFNSKTGHFTQVVWKGTREFGIGLGKITKGNSIKGVFCANYYPAGNMMGDFPENVRPPK